MAEENIPSTTVTPIKKASVHQTEDESPKVDVEDDRFEAYDVVFNGREKTILFDDKTKEVVIDKKLYKVDLEEFNEYFLARVNGNHKYKIDYQQGGIFLEGRRVDFTFKPSMPILERKRVSKEGETIIEAPLPGTVTEITTKIGDKVKIGQKLLVLEAMKMQNDILAEQDGYIKELFISKGDLVSSNQHLVLISSEK